MANNNQLVVPDAKTKMEALKMEVAQEVGVPLDQGDNRNLTTAQVGKVGGNMVKKLIEKGEQAL